MFQSDSAQGEGRVEPAVDTRTFPVVKIILACGALWGLIIGAARLWAQAL